MDDVKKNSKSDLKLSVLLMEKDLQVLSARLSSNERDPKKDIDDSIFGQLNSETDKKTLSIARALTDFSPSCNIFYFLLFIFLFLFSSSLNYSF